MDYSKTVNLLQTDFPMKGDLPRREPLLLEKWTSDGIYQKIQEHTKGRKTFLLHDGPPYANGQIHIGHVLNKVLKDIVVKYKTLAGFRSPYKPGWDCHGLPIEHALFKQLKKSKHDVPRIEFRQKAAEYALGFVAEQRKDFERLGIFGDWENPYLTLKKEYEAGILEVFYGLKDNGAIYRGKKPGYWCVYDETALAEAEVEHAEKKSDSVFVRFKVKPETIPAKIKNKFRNDLDLYVLIWTTTPWTLPANTGLAFNPGENYGLIPDKDGKSIYVVATKLWSKVFKSAAERLTDNFSELGVKGDDFNGMMAVNPLHGRESKVVTADYVTMEDGTGIVHIAPGHGVDDYGVGFKWKLDVLSPVDEKGRFDSEVGHPDLVGRPFFQ